MPTKHRPSRLLRKFVLWLALFLSVNMAFYILIPLVAANYIKRHLETQGYTAVEVEFGYPSPTRTYMPFLTLQKDLDGEHLLLTVRNLEFTYAMTELLGGHLRNITIERISIQLDSLPSAGGVVASSVPQQESLAIPPEPMVNKSDPVTESPSTGPIHTSLVSMARLLPVLPFESFSLGNVAIYRASATGPFRRMEMSGSIENRKGALKGVMTFRGEKVIPYSLLISINPSGDIAVILRSNELLSAPLLKLDSRVESSMQTGLAMHGSMHADLKQLTPFLALFMPLGPDLHKVDGNLHVDWEGATSHDVSVETLFRDPKTSLTGGFELDMHLPAWAGVAEDISIKVNGQINALPQEVRVNIGSPTLLKARMHSEALALPAGVKSFLIDADDLLTIEVKDHFATTLSFSDGNYTWAVEGFLRAQYGSETSPLGVQATLLRASGDGSNLSGTEGHLHSWGRAYHFPQDWPEVGKMEWNIEGNLTSANQHVELHLAPASFISSVDLQNGPLVIPESSVRLNQPWRIVYDSRTQKWKADLHSFPVVLKKFHWGDTQAAIQNAVLHITQFHGGPSSWEVNGKAIVVGIATTGKTLTWPVTNCGIGFWVKPEDVTLGIRLETQDKSVSAQGRIDHNFETNQGNVFATFTPQPFSGSRHRLSHILKPWSYPFDVISGEVSAKASVIWGPDESPADEGLQVTRGELSLITSHIDVSYHDVDVRDVSATLTVIGTGLDNVAMPVPAIVTVGSISHGVTVRNLSFALQLGFDGTTLIPTFDIKDFVGHVFEGEVSSPRIYFDSTRPSNPFVLKLDSLKLDKILQLEQQQGLEGTGLLNGFVPITLQDGDVEIKDGKVEAQPPGGIIRFRPLENAVNKLRQTNFNMDLILRALTNFHYDGLEARLNFGPSGVLKLYAKLEGKNPDMEDGRPVHFNMNIEENIPALLQSLRMVKDIEQQVDKLGRKLLQ